MENNNVVLCLEEVMKKFICLMLALVMVLSLAACGEKSPRGER